MIVMDFFFANHYTASCYVSMLRPDTLSAAGCEPIGDGSAGQAGLELANRRASSAGACVRLTVHCLIRRGVGPRGRVMPNVRACFASDGAAGKFWGICAGKVNLDCRTIFS